MGRIYDGVGTRRAAQRMCRGPAGDGPKPRVPENVLAGEALGDGGRGQSRAGRVRRSFSLVER